MTIKAIQTWYGGCYFRSRLEARWAVFFDAMDIQWVYEPEGFETPDGRYLPDFWLPEGQSWVEIKGAFPTTRDLARCAHVAAAVWSRQQKFRLFIGDIPRKPWVHPVAGLPVIKCASFSCIPSDPSFKDAVQQHGAYVDAGYMGGQKGFVGLAPTGGDMYWAPSNSEGLSAALTAARSARFEHGESGSQVRA